MSDKPANDAAHLLLRIAIATEKTAKNTTAIRNYTLLIALPIILGLIGSILYLWVVLRGR